MTEGNYLDYLYPYGIYVYYLILINKDAKGLIIYINEMTKS